MKVRNGFVSNSSSSSFIIAFSTKDTKEQHKKLKEVFGTFPKDYPIKNSYDFPAAFIGQIGSESPLTRQEYIELYGEEEDDLDENEKKVLKLIDDGWFVYESSFSDQDDPVDTYLCMSEVKYKDDELFISKEAAY